MGQHSKQEAEDAVQIDQQTVQNTGQFAFEAEVDQQTGQQVYQQENEKNCFMRIILNEISKRKVIP